VATILYNQALHFTFPFLSAANLQHGGGVFLPKSAVIDAGFTIGANAEFDPRYLSMFLTSVEKTATHLTLQFTADWNASYPGSPTDEFIFEDWMFEFIIALTDEELAPQYTYAKHILDGEDPEFGLAYVVPGSFSDLSSVPNGVYSVDIELEPAVITVQNYAVSKIIVANQARGCPTDCEIDPSSSSSLSSESSTSADDRILLTELVDDITLAAGYNISLDTSSEGVLTIRAIPGDGWGEQCEDLLIDESGVYPDDGSQGCQRCGDLLYSINGAGIGSSYLTIRGLNGIAVTSSSAENKLIVELTNKIPGLCLASS